MPPTPIGENDLSVQAGLRHEIEERLHQAAVGGLVDRGHEDDAVGAFDQPEGRVDGGIVRARAEHAFGGRLPDIETLDGTPFAASSSPMSLARAAVREAGAGLPDTIAISGMRPP